MSHKPLRRSSCHVLSETNMASSNHSNNDPASIQSIASTAISHIQQLVSLVEQRPTAASTSSNELQVATPRAGTALEELRRRFPTVSARSSRNAATGRYERSNTFRPYPNVRRTVGRPLTSETVSKDIVILDFGREKNLIPKKSEKAELERSGRMASNSCQSPYRLPDILSLIPCILLYIFCVPMFTLVILYTLYTPI